MTPAEVALVLAKCSAYDLRTVGRADVDAWSEILGAIDLPDGLEAVTRHYRESSDRAMPADVLRHARAAKRDRTRVEGVRSPALALPSRFETDTQRDARIANHLAACREAAIPKGRREQGAPTRNAWAELESATTGPAWLEPDFRTNDRGES